MTFQECLGLYPFVMVWQRMEVLYPDEKGAYEDYEKVHDHMVELIPESSEMRISIKHIDDKESHSDNSYWDVHGLDGKVLSDIPTNEGGVPADHQHANREITYAIEFISRNKWAGMVIDDETICNVSTIDIAVHGLWEMTFTGFGEDSASRELETIKERADKAKDINNEDFIEIADGIFCHKDTAEAMKKLLSDASDINKSDESIK